ncbi:MAG TPA: tyrosine-type recombinase/integrase, partial [Tepidisphaeraceae bacterium]|nr:tyrosine-type recombinase/integrase [Tepidisphaeraceae bacterium]
ILDPDWLTKFEAWMDARGIAGGTKNSYRSAVSGMYRLALRPQWRKKTHVLANPMAGTERDARRSRTGTLTIDQLRAWITAAPPHVKLALAVGALAPKLRLSSILNLRWGVNIPKALDFITVYDHKTIRHTDEPQVMPIDPQLQTILGPLWKPSGYVITFRGEPVKDIKTALRRAAKDAGIDYGRASITFHSLRHTMATLLAELGVPERQRQEVMGWLDAQTAQGYTHLRPTHERQPLALLSGAVQIADVVQGPVQETNRTTPKKPARFRVVRQRA